MSREISIKTWFWTKKIVGHRRALPLIQAATGPFDTKRDMYADRLLYGRGYHGLDNLTMEKAIKIEGLANGNKSKSTRAGRPETFYSIGRVVHERNAVDVRLKTCVWYMLVC